MHSVIRMNVWKFVVLTFVTAGLLVVSTGKLAAQTPDTAAKPKTDAEKLQDRLKLLEETVTELKK